MKFSIVIPCRNAARFLPQALDSVLTQRGPFTVELIVRDNCSADGTADLLRRTARRIPRGWDYHWQSTPDRGLYDAVNQGMALATGEVLAWLNADDIYLPGAFTAVAQTLACHPRIRWLKGITSYIDTAGSIVARGRCRLYHRPWIRLGIYGLDADFIQQDSCFWTRDLWSATGGVPPGFDLAGDYALWTAFAVHSPLTAIDVYVSAFRRHRHQLSRQADRYRRQCIARAAAPPALRRRIRCYRRIEARLPRALRPLSYRLAFSRQDLPWVSFAPGRPPRMETSHYYQVPND